MSLPWKLLSRKRVQEQETQAEPVGSPGHDDPALVESEGAEYGIYVYAICPGFIRTPLVEKQIPEQARDLGITEEEVRRRMSVQQTDDFYAEKADAVLCNDGDLAALARQLQAVLSRCARDNSVSDTIPAAFLRATASARSEE